MLLYVHEINNNHNNHNNNKARAFYFTLKHWGCDKRKVNKKRESERQNSNFGFNWQEKLWCYCTLVLREYALNHLNIAYQISYIKIDILVIFNIIRKKIEEEEN